jgi:hypothetical protein
MTGDGVPTWIDESEITKKVKGQNLGRLDQKIVID